MSREAQRELKRLDWVSTVVDACLRAVVLQAPLAALTYWMVDDAHGPHWAARGFAATVFFLMGKP